jgi:Helix-turn-helix domain
MKSQNDAVLAWLRKGTLTPLVALRKIGTLRLSARIYDLRKAGYQIDMRLVERGHAHVAEYRLRA